MDALLSPLKLALQLGLGGAENPGQRDRISSLSDVHLEELHTPDPF